MKEVTKKLEESERALRYAQHLGKIGSWKWNSVSDIITWSEEYCHIYGFDLMKKPPKYDEHLKAYTIESRVRLNEAVQRSIQKDKTYEIDLELENPKGSCQWVTERGAPKHDENGNVIGMFGTSQDITERKKEEEHTKEVDALKNKFIEIVSHQFRTPLGVIRWDLEAVLNRERGEVSPEQMEALKGAYDADLKIISRLGDLLMVMDIESKRISLSIDTVNLSDLFQSTSEEGLQLCRFKNLAHKIILPEVPIPRTRVDAEKIKDVVARLVDNAITYTKDGGRIAVKFFIKDNHIRFEISDTGVGIPLSEQPRIFERFHRGWNASLMKPDASGLSLFISKHYIEAHNGTIGFSSEENKGSTFWFELLIVQD